MNYLTLNDLLDLHTFAVERYGGRLGIKSQDQLQGALHAPRQIIFGEELYPDLAGKAAVLAFQLLKNRPFVAANEATALLAILRLLYLNDASLGDTPVEALADELRAVLHSEQDRDGLATWLRDRVQVEVEHYSDGQNH
jgi:death on curing protein